MVYSLWEHKDILSFAQAAAEYLQLPLVHISTDYTLRALFHKGIKYSLTDVSPQQFLWLFHHASFVVTNTFHGNMFSVIYRKNFINYSANGNRDARISTLHEIIGLKDRIISDIKMFKTTDKEIDYSKMEGDILCFQENGVDFLKKNINI